jgi:hypothetical protein
MSRHYFSYDEDEAYKEGKRDESHRRSDFTHNSFAFDGADRAYFDGREDQKREEREEERREEERQEERREEERQERRAYEREQERQREEEHEIYLNDQIQQQREAERKYFDSLPMQPDEMSPEEYDEANTVPSSEEELFRQILEDERESENTLEL